MKLNTVKKQKIIIYWSRRDFRLTDNPALYESIKYGVTSGFKILPLFILEPYMAKASPEEQFGYPSRFFIKEALPKFAENFPSFLIMKNTVIQTLKEIKKHYEIEIFVNEDIHPDFYKQIKKVESLDIKIHKFKDMLTINTEAKTATGNLYSVFTPFKKNVWASFVNSEILPKVKIKKENFIEDKKLINFKKISTDKLWENFNKNRKIKIDSSEIDLDDFLSKPKLENWYFSENEALDLFKKFIKNNLENYEHDRNFLAKDISNTATSKMSLGLAWGLISARTLMDLIKNQFGQNFENPIPNRSNISILTFISELIWREFYKYLLYHKPNLLKIEFQEKFRNKIKWVDNKIALNRFIKWIKGETGYPVVDAAMKQIAETGFMHNRSRMIVASILTKNFGVDWRWGQEYFRATLIDLDESSNNGGWQWSASVGADPKPIRIFNPELQAKKFDSEKIYQKKWLGQSFSKENYLKPIIEHKKARDQALTRYKKN